MSDSLTKNFGKVIHVDEEQIREHLGSLVRGTVEETLNRLLDAEADLLCNAARYERTNARKEGGSRQPLKIGRLTYVTQVTTLLTCAAIERRWYTYCAPLVYIHFRPRLFFLSKNSFCRGSLRRRYQGSCLYR